MEEENNNKNLSLEEHFPYIWNFFKSQLPIEIWEEWVGDLEENIQKKTKEQKYRKWQIKILYLLEILPIFHSAQKMGYLRWEELIPELGKKTGYQEEQSAGSSASAEEGKKERAIRRKERKKEREEQRKRDETVRKEGEKRGETNDKKIRDARIVRDKNGSFLRFDVRYISEDEARESGRLPRLPRVPRGAGRGKLRSQREGETTGSY